MYDTSTTLQRYSLSQATNWMTWKVSQRICSVWCRMLHNSKTMINQCSYPHN